MNRLLLIFLLALPAVCRGGHAAGLDIYYTHIAGNTYRVSLTIYGNCRDQPNNNYSSFFSGEPQIKIIDSAAKATFKTISLNLIPDSTKDVSPYCKAFVDQTNCKVATSTYQGYTRFVYSDTVTLPRKSGKWIFRFTSSMNPGCGGRLGRPTVNNLVGGNGTNVVLEAMLNNTVSDNSSPAFNSSVFSAYCINTPSAYYQQARDPQNDSLSYELVLPLRETNSCSDLVQPLPFATGYNPLNTIPNGFAFDQRSGTMIFTSDMVQVSAVATRIYEYRNGVLVGMAMREKIFKVLATCSNDPSVGRIDTADAALSGGAWSGTDSIIACPGNIIRFNIPVKSIKGDTIRAAVSGIPPGSSFLISGNDSKSPLVQFYWNTKGVASGVYTFLGSYQVNGCPLMTEGLVTYTIIINDGGSIKPSVVSKTNCIGKAAVQYEVETLYYPYKLTVRNDSQVVATFDGASAGTVTDSLLPGSYSITMTSPGAPCPKEGTFEVKDDGVYPFAPNAGPPVKYCRNGSALALVAKPDSGSLSGTSLNWYDGGNNYLPGSDPIPSTRDSGLFTYYVRAKYGVCESEPDSALVTIERAECNYDVTIHNAITPNGDGRNDRWVISNLIHYPNMSVQVFDKLGDKVYEKTGYQNDWDGGNLPSGVYYYLIRLNGPNRTSGTENFTGYLMIKR